MSKRARRLTTRHRVAPPYDVRSRRTSASLPPLSAHDVSSSWNDLPDDIIGRVVELFKQERRWCYVGPLLRRVCKDWRDAVDAIGLHVTLDKLPLLQLRRVFPLTARRHCIASLHVTPHFGSVFPTDRLGHESALASLKEVRLSRMDFGDEALAGLTPLGKRLQRMELREVKLTQRGFDAVSLFGALIELHLRDVMVLGEAPLDFQILGFLDQLKCLSIVKCPGYADMRHISRLEKLETLEFESDEAFVAHLETLSALTSLQSLSIMSPVARSHGLEFVTALQNLRAFKVNAHVITGHVFTTMAHLQTLVCSLNILQVTGGCFPQEYSVGIPSLGGPVIVQLRAQRQPFLCVYERRDMMTFTAGVMTSLDLAGIHLNMCELWMLTHLSSLRTLRLHEVCIVTEDFLLSAGRHPHHPDHNIPHYDVFQFPSLESLTLRMTMRFVTLMGRMMLPALRHLGIWFDWLDPLFPQFCLDWMPLLSEVSLGTRGLFSDDAVWGSFSKILCQCRSLRRIGWKNPCRELMAVDGHPFVRECERHGIAVDTDVSVFCDG